MPISCLFFGATADITAKRQIEIESAAAVSAREIFDQLMTDYPRLASHRLLFSINQQYSNGDEIVHDGDELAVFTAVSGG